MPARKNRASDSRAIEARAGEFSFSPAGQLQWSGRAEDWGSEWQAPPDVHRCLAQRIVKDEEGTPVVDRDGKQISMRCTRWKMRGAGLCLECAGGSEAVRKAVRDRLLGSADALVGRLLAIALADGTEAKDAIKAITEGLDRVGLRGGIEVSPDVPGWQQVWQSLQAGGADDGEPDV